MLATRLYRPAMFAVGSSGLSIVSIVNSQILGVIPFSTISTNQFVGFLWPPGSCRVGMHSAGGQLLPAVDDAVYDAPGSLYFVAANKERRIADHGVGQQALVGFG